MTNPIEVYINGKLTFKANQAKITQNNKETVITIPNELKELKMEGFVR